MASWFGSVPECPIDAPSKQWIDWRWAWLIEQFGLERARTAPVILPTPEFFPEAFNGSPESARVILDRVCGYANIAPDAVELNFYQDKNPVHEGEWRHGTAGLYQEEAGTFRIWLEAGNLEDPLALVATMAHELGHVHLLGFKRLPPDAEDHEPLTDLLTVYFGLGVFTANSVLRERYWHAGAMAGWDMGRSGYLSMPMYGYALARLAHTRGEESPAWAKHLRPDVSAAFVKASRFLAMPSQPQATPITSELEIKPATKVEDPDRDVDAPEDGACEDSAAAALGEDRQPISSEQLLERYARGDRDFRSLDLSEHTLSGADLRESNLENADLSRADLTSAVLASSELRDAILQEAVVRGTSLRGANLRGADLSGADLTCADLSGADIREADFRGALLDGAVLVGTLRNRSTDFSGVDLSRVVCDADLSKEDLRGNMMSDQLAAGFARGSRWIALLLFVFLAVLGGCLIGWAAGSAMDVVWGGGDFAGVGAVSGAIVLGILNVLNLFRLRAKRKSRNRL